MSMSHWCADYRMQQFGTLGSAMPKKMIRVILLGYDYSGWGTLMTMRTDHRSNFGAGQFVLLGAAAIDAPHQVKFAC
jgi:hypothetical protein